MVSLAFILVSLSGASAQGPAAMVLAARGEAEVRPAKGPPHRAAPKDLLYPADRLAVPRDGEVTIVFLDGGVKERVKPGVEVTIEATGAVPADAVARLKPVARAVAASLRNVRLSVSGGRAAAAPFRSSDPRADLPPAITPIAGATILSDRPVLAWKPVRDVMKYQVDVSIKGSGKTVWNTTCDQPTVTYPEANALLPRGRSYYWSVSDPKGKTLVEGSFSIVTAEEARSLAEVVPLLQGDDPAGVLEAAMAFEAHGVYDQALAAYDRLVALSPDEPAFRESQASLRQRAGLVEGAEAKP